MHTYLHICILPSTLIYIPIYPCAHSSLSTCILPYTPLHPFPYTSILLYSHTYIYVCAHSVARYPIVLILARVRVWACIITIIFSYSNYKMQLYSLFVRLVHACSFALSCKVLCDYFPMGVGCVSSGVVRLAYYYSLIPLVTRSKWYCILHKYAFYTCLC